MKDKERKFSISTFVLLIYVFFGIWVYRFLEKIVENLGYWPYDYTVNRLFRIITIFVLIISITVRFLFDRNKIFNKNAKIFDLCNYIILFILIFDVFMGLTECF